MGTLQGSQVSSVSRHKTSNVPNAKAKGQFCQINSVLACPTIARFETGGTVGTCRWDKGQVLELLLFFFFFVKAYTWIELN